MSIIFDSENRVFKLDAKNTSYLFHVSESGYLLHLYYGRKVRGTDFMHLLRLRGEKFVPSPHDGNGPLCLDTAPQEYSTSGVGDFREPSLQICDINGGTSCKVTYLSHKIYKGKPEIEGIPSTFADENEATTLEIECHDKYIDLNVTLIYTVFENLDVITRSVRVRNDGKDTVHLKRVLSACIEFDNMDYEMITLHGTWARERHPQRVPLHYGKQTIDSARGSDGHQFNPFVALCTPETTEKVGEVYGFNLVYSGSFFASAEVSQHAFTRFTAGINPYDFDWQLDSGEVFSSPELVMVYSHSGLGQMSRTFHDLYRNHLIRGQYKDIMRPVLLNCWEAVYFDFDDKKILEVAKEASELGIELIVMDDGWFGKRNDDTTSLGDWFVNEDKIKCGLPELVRQVNEMGVKFGIWFEPEMISPVSELYKEHPDWCIHIKDRNRSQCRSQLVLDFSRQEVRDYIYNEMKKILTSANIEYVKWDMNRQLTEVGNEILPASRQREIWHRYVLGVYDIQKRLTEEFPHILFENCASGGARFDPAMLYFSPQIWASDDTDAIERLKIQYGTNLVYPCSTIGAHVSAVPNHIVGRVTPINTRGAVALAGTFGYELDVTKLSDEDKWAVKEQIADYKRYNHLVRDGDLYRLSNPFEKSYDSWMFVSKDKSEALFEFVLINHEPNGRPIRVHLDGLCPRRKYNVNGEVYSGEALMYGGLDMYDAQSDYASVVMHITEVKQIFMVNVHKKTMQNML